MTAVDDAIRREAIADYGVIGEAPASSLEGLLRIAASVCRVDKAVVNIIDDRFQHQIAALGFDAAVCAREDSMCAAVYLSGQQVVLPDARDDERFTDNPFVTGELGRVRFYASSPLRTPDGVIIGTLCVFDDDVAELDAAQRSTMDILAGQVVDVLELRRAGRELRSSNDRLSTFAGQVSHDLRNPLTALVGYLELASDSLEVDEAQQATVSLARAEAAANRMTDLVGDLLSYARIGGAARHFGPVSVREAAVAAVDDLDAALRERGARVSLDVDGIVFGDATLIRLVLQNLIANSVKFTAAAGIPPMIEVSTTRTDNALVIRVEDNGPGIPEDERGRVVGLMERGTSAQGVEGLGLGLSVCRRIAQEHGGRLGIDASPTGGAAVWVTFPLLGGQ
ncbi:GAF domain-containing sensor histidine kinase [Microbacterium aurantiacum]|nr:GAF domain-containing sensor histidine kinase [Microbacterium chocolatum]